MTDRSERIAEERERIAAERDREADERERTADERERTADRRADEQLGADQRGNAAGSVVDQLDQLRADQSANAARRRRYAQRASRSADSAEPGVPGGRDWAAERREFVADDRQEQADAREVLADERELLADRRDEYLQIVDPIGTDDVPVGGRSAAPTTDEQASRNEAAAARDAAALARRVADRNRAAIAGAHPLAAEFVKMTRSLLRAETVGLAMVDVVDAAVRFVNGCDAASFSAYADEVVTTLASTGPIADEADAAQYRASDGPCLQAIRTLQLVIAVDLTQDERWPTFVATTPAVRSVMSAPVSTDERAATPFGSLNSYGLHANAFDSEDADTAILLTAHLGVLLRIATMTSEANNRVDQLVQAIASRDVIGQAKGILMERERLTAAQAFDVLRAASQRLNRKLREVADQVAASGEIPTRPDR